MSRGHPWFSQKMFCAAGFHKKCPTRRSQKPTPSTKILKKSLVSLAKISRALASLAI
jgi:hypothetical protein